MQLKENGMSVLIGNPDDRIEGTSCYTKVIDTPEDKMMPKMKSNSAISYSELPAAYKLSRIRVMAR